MFVKGQSILYPTYVYDNTGDAMTSSYNRNDNIIHNKTFTIRWGILH